MEKVERADPRRRATHAYAAGATAVGLTLTGIVLGRSDVGATGLGLSAVALAYATSGAVLAAKRPGNAIGWVMLLIGLSESILVALGGYTAYAHDRQSVPLADLAAWTGGWLYIPGLGLTLTFLLLLFPTGHPPTPRWRWVGWVAVVGLAVGMLGSAVALWSSRLGMLADPDKDVSPHGLAGNVAGLGLALAFGVAGIASIVSLAVRWRRSSGDERQQLRWFLLAAGVVVVGFAITGWDSRFVVLLIGMLLLPVAVAVAVMKYRLYELDVVIKKALIVLLLAAGLTALSLVVLLLVPLFAVGTLTGWERGLFVVGVAIGTAFGPLRRAARRIADHLVYGRRATPYEVLAEFSGRLGSTYAHDDVSERMAQLLREATGADVARVWLRIDDAMTAVATAPRDAAPAPWTSTGTEIHYRGALLGGLSVEMPANDPLDPARRQLIDDLASQAGPVLANLRLIEDLRSSRRRLVAVQDDERRRIERDIHDGAQQQLVALAVQLRLAQNMVGKDPERERELLGTLAERTSEALEDLRDLARGIYPPLLADKGLPAALEAQARKAVVPATVEAHGIGRFGQDVEAAVYFSVLEALQNVAKYAQATTARIALTNGAGELRFSVTDDGRGFDPTATGYGTGLQGIADRLAAIGGELTVTSAPGAGTTIAGAVPA